MSPNMHGSELRPIGTPAHMEHRFALTAPQIAIWLDEALHPERPIYNTGQTLTIRTTLDTNCFVTAVRRVVAENDALRLRFVQRGGEIYQEVADELSVDVELSDFSAEKDPETMATTWLERVFWKPFAATDFPLFNFGLAKVAENQFIWLQKYHHLIIDATGRQLVAARVATIYNALLGGEHPQPPRGGTYRLASDLEKKYLSSEQYSIDEVYWRSRFADLPEPIVQIDVRLSDKSRSGRATRLDCDLTRDESTALRAFSRHQGSTVFRVLLGLAWSCFSRLYRNPDLVFGVSLANRSEAEIKHTVGLFSKVMPFRPRLNLTMSFGDALSAIEKDLKEDLKHQRYPTDHINRILRLRRFSRDGLYDVLINYVRNDYGFDIGGAPISCSNLSAGFVVPWSIMAMEYGVDDVIRIVIDYDAGRIKSDEAARFLRCFRMLLSRAPDAAEIAIGQLPMISTQELTTLISERHGKVVNISQSATLATLLAEQVTRTPGATALISGTDRLSYANLHARADRLAQKLAVLGVGPDTVVGVCLPRTIHLIIAILAVHKAGGAYLSLDPNYPPERITFMIGDAGAKIILTARSHAALLPEGCARLVFADEEPSEDAHELPTLNSGNCAEPSDLAYVLYTSGSTGRPKGVAVTHRGAVNVVLSSLDLLEEGDCSGVLFATSVNFDISVYEIFLPLASGGTIILVDNLFDLKTAPALEQVRLVNTVPSLLEAFLKWNSLPIGVRVINLIGEALPRTLADRIFSDLPHVRLFNLYGPTETTVQSTGSVVNRHDRRSPPIGKPLWNTNVYVLDELLQPVPDGAIGELWIGGIGLARGYLNRPELTRERFKANPFGEGRIYRSGDLVRWLSDGQLEYIGRVDHQVKINGLRIELGEIEERLRTHPAIRGATVTAPADSDGRGRLVGYVVANPGIAKPDDEVVREYLGVTLPAHMIPTTLMWLDALPLTATGKVDRKALPAPPVLAAGVASSGKGRPPLDEIEDALIEVWGGYFNGRRIDVDENYFELGGDSLTAFWLIARCNERLGLNLPLSTLFANPTIERLAIAIRAAAGEDVSLRRQAQQDCRAFPDR